MNKEKLTNLAINQSGFIFDPTSGYSYNANETAIWIINQIIAGSDMEDLVNNLVEEYEVERDDAISDIEYFMRVLENYTLVDRSHAY